MEEIKTFTQEDTLDNRKKKKMKLYSAWNSTRHLQVSAAYRGKSVSGVNSLIWMEAYGQTHGLDVTMQ